MPEPKFIEAVVKATGRKQRVPASWRGTPLWGKFRLPPSAAKSAPAQSDPEPVVEDVPVEKSDDKG